MRLSGRLATNPWAPEPESPPNADSTPLTTQSLAWLFRRVGPFLAILAALVALKWPAMFDLEAYLAAAACGGGRPRARTPRPGPLASINGARSRSTVSPPFVAQVLAPFSSLPTGVVFAGWTVAGSSPSSPRSGSSIARRSRPVRRSSCSRCVYVWGSLVLGQVNLFTLAGLLLAFGSRSERLAGLGLALADHHARAARGIRGRLHPGAPVARACVAPRVRSARPSSSTPRTGSSSWPSPGRPPRCPR